MPSPTSVATAPGSFYNDSASSPTSSKGSREKDFAPQTASLGAPTSPYPQTVEPSPVDSNGTAGTDTTEIDETPQEHSQSSAQPPATNELNASPLSPGSQLRKLDTALAGNTAPDEESNPQSVIHAPEHFGQFTTTVTPPVKACSSSSPSDRSGHTVLSPTFDPSKQPLANGGASTPTDRLSADGSTGRKDSSTSPLKTDLPAAPVVDRSTPQAQTIQEAEEEWQKRKRLSANLADIPESSDGEPPSTDPSTSTGARETPQHNPSLTTGQEHQMRSLKSALDECWTLCNTLANLSSTHRNRIFTYRGQSGVQEQAWRSCWRLCQNLYENRADDHDGLILPTLEMCREFCQALFDARLKGDEVSDSVLRVSFELNNHLYNTHDRNLPSAFQERTLDFYLTLCHRLMKQRTSLPPETDALLRACWTLAEMLFSIRQNAWENRAEDEELLGSAVQACWDLCDLFREGWTQVRPSSVADRGTPRPPHQVLSSFSPTSNSIRSNSLFSSHQSSPSVTRSASTHSLLAANGEPKPFPPETPTTIFEDMNESPLDADDGNIPNILVLGPEKAGQHASRNRWTDSASQLSGYSESSQRTSSTATAPGQSSATAANLTRIRILLLRAAFTAGFKPRTSSPESLSPPPSAGAVTSPKTLTQQNESLITFVRALPGTAFGTATWQKGIVENYKKFVVAWPAIIRSSVSTKAIMTGDGTPVRASKKASSTNGENEMVRVAATIITTGSAQTRTTAQEISSAVRWMCRKPSNTWLVDLHRAVFAGVGIEDVAGQGAAIVG